MTPWWRRRSASSEAEVRKIISAINEKIREANRKTIAGAAADARALRRGARRQGVARAAFRARPVGIAPVALAGRGSAEHSSGRCGVGFRGTPRNRAPGRIVPSEAARKLSNVCSCFQGKDQPAEGASSLEELEREICELAAHIAAATCRWLELLAEFDDRGAGPSGASRSCAHWFSWRCSLGLRAAREHCASRIVSRSCRWSGRRSHVGSCPTARCAR